MSEYHIKRRTVLKGMGAAFALPFFEGMLPTSALAQTAAKQAPVRLGFVFVPNGMNMAHWTPTAEGALTTLPDTLSPLAKVKDSINVLTGLTQHNAAALGDGPGDHARSAAVWLTGVHPKKTSGADIHNGPSVDQVAAMKLGSKTKFPSLEIGCERSAQAGDCDSGYSCAYSSCISWRSETTPVAKEVNPRLVFERLFGNGARDEEAQSKFLRREFAKSVLDFVMEDAAKLKDRLGKRDQRKLDEYFTSIREVERRLVRIEAENAEAVAAGYPKPDGLPKDYGEHLRLMGDMMVLAFQADLTRVCTFMFANDGSNRPFRSIGINEGHHEISHHGNDPVKLEKKKQIDQFQIEQLAYVLNKLQATEEATGTLLDNSLIVFGAGISDGNRHNHDDLPILVAGRGGGLPSGKHIRYPNQTPLNNLYLSILDRFGVPAETLGDSTGKLQGLF